MLRPKASSRVYLFENIPQAKTAEELKALLPMNLERDTINKLKA